MDLTPNKWCLPGLTTGLNDGSSFANAWQSFAAMEAGRGPGDIVGVPYGTYLGNILELTATGTYDNVSKIVACDIDGSALTLDDILTNDKRVRIDGESSLTNCVTANGASYTHLVGFRWVNATSHGCYFITAISTGFLMAGCAASSCGGRAVLGSVYFQNSAIMLCDFENCDIGVDVHQGTTVCFNIIRNCPSGGVRVYRWVLIKYNIVINCGQSTTHHAIYVSNSVSTIIGNTLYNCVNGLRFIADYHNVLLNRFIGTTNEAIKLDLYARNGIHFQCNAFYNNGSNYTIDEGGKYDIRFNDILMTETGLVDPENGNFMSDQAVDEATGIEYQLDEVNKIFLTAGLPPEITSGGGSGAILIKKFYGLL